MLVFQGQIHQLETFLGKMIDVSPQLNSEIVRRMDGVRSAIPRLRAKPILYLAKAGGSEAERHFRQAAALDRDLETAHYRLARLYRKLGQSERARLAMEQYRRAHAAASAKPAATAQALVVQ